MDVSPYASRSSWFVGIDVGQASDPTAVAAVERIAWGMSGPFERTHRHPSGQWVRSETVADVVSKKPSDELHVRALRRLPLGVSYVEQIRELTVLLGHPQLQKAAIFLDATGVGRPVADLFRKAQLRFTAVTITGGREVQDYGQSVSVPKLELVSRLQASLHSSELKIAKSLPEAAVFVRELQEFRASWTDAGNLQFGARQGAHDDLVLAAALAVWGATRPKQSMRVLNGSGWWAT